MLVGKARIEFRVEGCIDCGVTFSAGWETAQRLKVMVGDRRTYIELKRCGRCAAERGSKWPTRTSEVAA